MGQAYTPGLQVQSRTRITRIRELPLPGKTLVSVGDTVTANQAVLSAELPGDLDIIRVAERLGFEPEDVIPGMKVSVGETVEGAQTICELKTFFGLFTSTLHAPRGGVVEFFTEANAHVGIRQASIPLSVDAYIAGRVTDISEGKSVTIETDGALIQGIFGVGGERLGTVRHLSVARDARVTRETLEQLPKEQLSGAILVGGARFSGEALSFAAEHQAVGVLTGSIDAATLRAYVGFDIGVSITGDEDVPLTLIISEGFGDLPLAKRIDELASELDGQVASLNGATQVRAGAMRPELIVSRTDRTSAPEAESGGLVIGARVRLIRVPYFGELAEVSELPKTPEQIETGARVRVLRARLESGEEVTVPRANVELLKT